MKWWRRRKPVARDLVEASSAPNRSTSQKWPKPSWSDVWRRLIWQPLVRMACIQVSFQCHVRHLYIEQIRITHSCGTDKVDQRRNVVENMPDFAQQLPTQRSRTDDQHIIYCLRQWKNKTSIVQDTCTERTHVRVFILLVLDQLCELRAVSAVFHSRASW